MIKSWNICPNKPPQDLAWLHLGFRKRTWCKQATPPNPQKNTVACILCESSRRPSAAVPSWLVKSHGSDSANILFVRAVPRVLTSTPVSSRIFPRGIFIFVETQKDKLFEHGMNATGWAVQSSHTGVAICNINTCKIQNTRQPFSNVQPESPSERLQLVSAKYWGHVPRRVALCGPSFLCPSALRTVRNPDALRSSGHPMWLHMNIIK